MSSDSAVSILFDGYGNQIGDIFDGYQYRLLTDTRITDGYSIVGITNVLGQKALKVDVIKTVSGGGVGSGGTSSNFSTQFPTAGTAVGFFDGYYMQNAEVYNLNTSVTPNEFVLGTNLRTYSAGGSVETGTVTHPLQVNVDGYIQTNPNVNVVSFPNDTHVIIDGYVNTNPNVNVLNFPANQTVSGSVSVSNFPATQAVSGTITATQGTSPWITHDTTGDGYLQSILANQTNGTQQVIIDGYVQTNPNVNVLNFPATQAISGTVTSNQGTANTLANSWPIKITDGYGNLQGSTVNPVQVNIDGYVQTNPNVNVLNFPANQIVSGSVSVSNFPATQAVTQSTSPWITHDTTGDGYLQSILANQTNGTQQTIVDGYVQTNPNVNVITFPNDVHVVIDGYVQTNPNVNVINSPTVNQGTANTLSNGWPVELTDGSNILGTISHPLQTNVDGYVQTNPNVNVLNFPTTQTIAGTVTSNQGTANSLSNSWPIKITDGYGNLQGSVVNPLIVNFSPEQHIIVDGYVQTNPNVNVLNFPATQTVSGSVAVSNFPATQSVTQNTSPWITHDTTGDGYLQSILANQTNGTQQVVIDGYVTTNPNVNQGAPNTLANAWPTEITDGTHGPVAVKAPNVAAVASDAAIVVAISPNNTITTSSGFTADRTATGTITSTQNVAINSQGTNTVSIKTTGGWTGTLSFQASLDGVNWDSVNAITNLTGAIVNSTTVNGDWFVAIGGIQQIRVLGNTVATGTATVELDAGAGAQIISLGAPIPTGSNVIGSVTQGTSPWLTQDSIADGYLQSILANQTNSTQHTHIDGYVQTNPNVNVVNIPIVNQGSANTLSNAWPVEVTDGTNVLGTVAHPIQVNVDGYVQTNPNVNVNNFPTTQAVSGTVTSNQGTANTLVNAWPIELTDGYGNLQGSISNPIQVNIDGYVQTNPNVNVIGTVATTAALDNAPSTQNITAQDVGSTTTIMANNQVFVTGSATANSTASFTFTSYESIKIQVTGSWTGTLTCEMSLDNGTTWVAIDVHQSGVQYTATSFTNNFFGGLNVSGATNFRVRATAAWTGTATVQVVQTVNNNSIYVNNAISLQDSTTQSILNTIKRSGVSALTTDSSLVVAISPNSNTIQGTTATGSAISGNPIVQAGLNSLNQVEGISATLLNDLIHLNVVDLATQNKLDQIIVLLTDIRDALVGNESRGGSVRTNSQ